jgi:hypothetical protein
MQQLITWSQGNPGALTFLMELLKTENIPQSISIMTKLEELTSIRGTNLYVLWSDLGGKDLKVVEQLCKNCPDEILVDACSRQDYSGRELVKPYL